MLSRRGFLGTLAAIVAAPSALYTQQSPITFGLISTGGYSYRTTYITSAGETLSYRRGDPASVARFYDRLDATGSVIGRW